MRENLGFGMREMCEKPCVGQIQLRKNGNMVLILDLCMGMNTTARDVTRKREISFLVPTNPDDLDVV